jgi:RNA 3'-terminal phosphate cyclase
VRRQGILSSQNTAVCVQTVAILHVLRDETESTLRLRNGTSSPQSLKCDYCGRVKQYKDLQKFLLILKNFSEH